MSKQKYQMHPKQYKCKEKQPKNDEDTSKKLKEILQLQKLLRKYHDHLVQDQTPLTASIHNKFKHIQKVRKIKHKNIKPQKTQLNVQADSQKKSVKCYICRGELFEPSQNTKFCKYCWEFNRLKRQVKVNMQGKIALVTGGRIKIGYETALSLLRNGCKVIVTSRFADDTLNRYKKQEDYQIFKNNLQIIQVCLSKIQNVLQLVNYIKNNYKKIDILINNAAQTIRRPQIFYQNVVKDENDKEGIIKAKLSNYLQQSTLKSDLAVDKKLIENYVAQNWEKFSEIPSINNSQLQKIMESEEQKLTLVPKTNLPLISKQILDKYHSTYFPDKMVDQHCQQIDLRPINSWVHKLQDLHIVQVIQVLMINLIAPLILIQELYPLLKKQMEQQSSYIVNVSSMEGNFSRTSKTQYHPQTNIAKAGLNMLTRTSGQAFKKDYNIVMIAVDTGWNTIQQPNSYHKQSPIDCKDGSARILDPIYRKLTKSGVFYKDFDIFDW